MFKKINYFFQAIIIYLLFIIGRLIGINIARKIFSYLFLSVGPLFKSKKIIENNLKIFSDKLTDSERKKIINGMWKNYGMTFIEYIYLDYFKKNNSLVFTKGSENIVSLIDNKPVIFVSGHFANFELMSMEIRKRKIKLATIYRPLNNFFLNPFMEFLRKKYICENQIKKGIGGLKNLITLKKKKYSSALMIDQRVTEGILSNFFNEKALTTTVPAQLVKKFNIPIVPVYIERIKDINFKIVINQPIKFSKDTSIQTITDELNQILEGMILKNPDQWIWSHNRWK